MTRTKKRAPGASTSDSRVSDIDRAPAERWQRGSDFELAALDSDGPRKVQRVYDGVSQLYSSNRSGDVEVAPAARWAWDYEHHQRSPYVHPATAGI